MDRPDVVAIVGVGLIGGSIGLALRRRGLAVRVVGIGRDREKLARARALGVIDRCETDMAAGVADADIVVVCTPVGRIAADVIAAARAGKESALLTDAGSTKAGIVAGIEADPVALGGFVGAHPIAGSERQGAESALADLFQGRACVLTPTEQTPTDRLERARAFWRALGARVVEMTPEAHDEALALTSHLPHAVAAALAACVPANFLPLAAGAYRDGTRVAASDASLWADIFLQNRKPLLAAIDRFSGALAALRSALAAGDSDALRTLWLNAREFRRRFDDEATTATEPDNRGCA